MSMPSIAPHIAAWGDSWPSAGMGPAGSSASAGGAGGVPPNTFPDTLLVLRVELFINGAWVDVSTYVKYEEKITIVYGRSGEQSEAPPSTCRLTFKNGSRQLSPRNTASDFYPYLNRSTKLRVWLNAGSGDSLRFTGEVPEWPPRWTNGEDRTVTVEASGILRRLQQGTEPTKSAWRQHIDTVVPAAGCSLLAYWPVEDTSTATVAASAIIGGAPMYAGGGSASAGGVKFGAATQRTQGAYTGFEILAPATQPLASLGQGGILVGEVPVSQLSGLVFWTVYFVGRTWAFSIKNVTLARWWTPGGTFEYWEVRMLSSDGSFNLIGIKGTTETTIINIASFTAPDLVEFTIASYETGTGNIFTYFTFARAGSGYVIGAGSTDTRAGSHGKVRKFWANPNGTTIPADPVVGSENQTNDIVVGHIRIYDDYRPGSLNDTQPNSSRKGVVTPWDGFAGERPTDRFARICSREGIDYVINESVVDTQTMGPQATDTRLGNLRLCELACEGVIDETRAGALELSPRSARYVPDVLLTLDYAEPTYGNQVYTIQPTDDDLNTFNDWTVDNGASTFVRAVQTTGPLNVNPPEDDPEGISSRPNSKTLSLFLDRDVADHAYWRLRKGTVDELRYPSIKFLLHRNPELIPQWLAMNLNSRMQVINPPDDIGPDTVAQYLGGYTETLTQLTWDVEVTGEPVATGEVYRWNDATGAARYDCKGSTLASDITTSTTSISLNITDRCVWAHDYGDYLIRIGGEDMLVTAVAAATGTFPAQSQTLTVTRSINGAILTHRSGTAVRLKAPARYGL